MPIMVPTTIAAEAHGPRPLTSSKRFSLIPLRGNDAEEFTLTELVHVEEDGICSGHKRLTRAPPRRCAMEPIRRTR